MKRWTLASSTVASLVALPLVAAAQSCRVDVVPLAFGVYDPARAAPTDTRTDIALACGGDATARSPGSVSIHVAGDAVRELGGTSHTLLYQLFEDAALSRPWREPAALAIALPDAAAGRSSEARVPIYGRIAPGQWVPAGVYGDTVEIVVTF